jgi:hypothetical protein
VLGASWRANHTTLIRSAPFRRARTSPAGAVPGSLAHEPGEGSTSLARSSACQLSATDRAGHPRRVSRPLVERRDRCPK